MARPPCPQRHPDPQRSEADPPKNPLRGRWCNLQRTLKAPWACQAYGRTTRHATGRAAGWM
eukprot:9029677-Alexandrium_andersonii.AAC.1